MKFFFQYILVLIIFAGAAPAFGQDDVIVINSEEIDVHRRPLVTFPHGRHEENIDCERCHHDFDDFGVKLSIGAQYEYPPVVQE